MIRLIFNKIPRSYTKYIKKLKYPVFKALGYDHQADGLMAVGHNTEHLQEKNFLEAWNFGVEKAGYGWNGNVPDIKWRAHISVWAAGIALEKQGDFVECGVHTGILSHIICKFHNFESINKQFYLFDTYNGIPVSDLDDNEKKHMLKLNKDYFECFEQVSESFAPYPNVKLVRGVVPFSFKDVSLEKIAFISLDMNNATAEREAIGYLWDHLVEGGVVVFDDYGFKAHEAQKLVIDEFMIAQGQAIATLPTGQGLLIKS